MDKLDVIEMHAKLISIHEQMAYYLNQLFITHSKLVSEKASIHTLISKLSKEIEGNKKDRAHASKDEEIE